jgi:hypothetical protein
VKVILPSANVTREAALLGVAGCENIPDLYPAMPSGLYQRYAPGLYQAMPSGIAQALNNQARLHSLLKNSPIAD